MIDCYEAEIAQQTANASRDTIDGLVGLQVPVFCMSYPLVSARIEHRFSEQLLLRAHSWFPDFGRFQKKQKNVEDSRRVPIKPWKQ